MKLWFKIIRYKIVESRGSNDDVQNVFSCMKRNGIRFRVTKRREGNDDGANVRMYKSKPVNNKDSKYELSEYEQCEEYEGYV